MGVTPRKLVKSQLKAGDLRAEQVRLERRLELLRAVRTVIQRMNEGAERVENPYVIPSVEEIGVGLSFWHDKTAELEAEVAAKRDRLVEIEADLADPEKSGLGMVFRLEKKQLEERLSRLEMGLYMLSDTLFRCPLDVIDELRIWLHHGDELDQAIAGLEGELGGVMAAMADCPVNLSLRKRVVEDEVEVKMMVYNLVVWLIGSFRVTGDRMSPDEIMELVELIVESYGDLSLDEVAGCFGQAKVGAYGQVFNRIDQAVILGWLREWQKQALDVWEGEMERVHAQNRRAEPAGVERDAMLSRMARGFVEGAARRQEAREWEDG